MNVKPDNWLTGLYRSGVLAGILALLWMQSHFTTKSESQIQWQSHDTLRDSFLIELRSGIRDAKDSIQRIEIKLDSILKVPRAGTTATNNSKPL